MERPTIKRLSDATLSDQTQNSQAKEALGESIELANCTDCKKPVWISCFFDGTGNNYGEDGKGEMKPDLTKYSNIAKLSWFAHPKNNKKTRIYNFYAPGVGTPFPEIGDSGQHVHKAIGMANAGFGQARLDWMFTQVNNAISKHMPHVSQINVAIFGFSRGAALARAFVHRLGQECKKSGDDLLWTKGAGVVLPSLSKLPKLVIYYLGILDTVASVGYGGSDVENLVRRGLPGLLRPLLALSALVQFNKIDEGGHYGWAQDISIPKYVRHCDHFIAAHEVREKFPSDSTRIERQVPFNVREMLYPGMHSDVGGGYARNDQEGRTNMLANIVLCNLYFSAYARGVPFKTPQQIQVDVGAQFEISADLENAFKQYWSMVPAYSTLEEGIVAHMQLYYHWRRGRTIRLKTKLLAPSGGVDPWMKITDEEWEADVQSIANRCQSFRLIRTIHAFEEAIYQAWRGELRQKLQKDELKLFDHFFDTYVHDSIAGFKKQMSEGYLSVAERSRWARNRVYFVGRNKDKKYMFWQYAEWSSQSTKPQEQVTQVPNDTDTAAA